MYENNSAGFVDLHKTVYALKCPVCGAECKTRENGECPYCGAYLEFRDETAPQTNVNAGIPMQAYSPPPANPQQYVIPHQEAERRVRSWSRTRAILSAIYLILAPVSIIGATLLNEGDKGYDLVMFICALIYFPMTFFLPILFSASRPDDCIRALNMPPRMNKVLAWLLYGGAEFLIMIVLTAIATSIGGE